MVTVYTGLSKSGKTKELLKEYNKIKNDKKNRVLLVKCSNKNLRNMFIESSCGMKHICDIFILPHQCGVIDMSIADKDLTDIFIDDAHFIDEDIIYLIQNYPKINFYFAGLEFDVNKNRIGHLNVLRNMFTWVKFINLGDKKSE